MINRFQKNQITARNIRDSKVSVSTIETPAPVEVSAKTQEIITVKTISTTNVTTGIGTINGVAVVQGDVYLRNGQTDKTENGLWVASTTDYRTDDSLNDVDLIRVLGGTYKNTYWLLKNQIEIGDDIEYSQLTPYSPILDKEITLTFLQLQNLHTTPIDLIDAVSGKYIQVLGIYLRYNYVTAYISTDILKFGVNSELYFYTQNDIFTKTADYSAIVQPASFGSSLEVIANSPFQVWVTNPLNAGTSTLTINLVYRYV